MGNDTVKIHDCAPADTPQAVTPPKKAYETR